MWQIRSTPLHTAQIHAMSSVQSVAQERIEGVAGLDKSFVLEITLQDDTIDVCIGAQRCIINRLPELQGSRLFFFCENGAVRFAEIEGRLL